jgi:SMC interacting uncharacterized protein involved in chromosome segregation
MSKLTPAKRKKLNKIKEEIAVTRAELNISKGLQRASVKSLRALVKINQVKASAIVELHDRQIQKIEAKIEDELKTLELPEKTLEEECDEHNEDIRNLNQRLSVLKLKRHALLPTSKVCERCGQWVSK